MLVEWDHNGIFFTGEELTRIHLHFMNHEAQRLFALIARSDPSKASPFVKKLIEPISNAFPTCQTFKSAPLKFKSTIPSDYLIFNHTISIELIWLDENPAIHIIDEQTGFRNA